MGTDWDIHTQELVPFFVSSSVVGEILHL